VTIISKAKRGVEMGMGKKGKDRKGYHQYSKGGLGGRR